MTLRRVPLALGALCLLLGAQGGLAEGADDKAVPGREILLTEARSSAIRAEVERALEHHLGENVQNVSLGLTRPRLVRTGEEFELRFDSGRILLSALDVGGIRVDGSVQFEDLRLDYAALGVGEFKLTADPRVTPNLNTSIAEFERFMEVQGLRETFLDFDEATGEVVLGGRRPAKVFLFRVNPHVTVRGRFTLEDSKVGFAVTRVDVREASGAVAREVEARVRRLASQTVDLDQVLSGLRVHSIRIGGGEIRVTGAEGGVLFAHHLPGGGPAAG
jgi:hypothetical protein